MKKYLSILFAFLIFPVLFTSKSYADTFQSDLTQLASNGNGRVTFAITNPPAGFNFNAMTVNGSWDNSNWAYGISYQGGCPTACVINWVGTGIPFYIKLTDPNSSITFNESLNGGGTYTQLDLQQLSSDGTGRVTFKILNPPAGFDFNSLSSAGASWDNSGWAYAISYEGGCPDACVVDWAGQSTTPFYVKLANATSSIIFHESVSPVVTSPLVLAINAGGGTQDSFVADIDSTGGSTYTSSDTVDTNAVTTPAPQTVYQSVRYGNFSYSIPNLIANGTYTVRLHFSEPYWGTGNNGGGDGSRIFNVSVNGSQVLSNYDIYGNAGGANRAIIEQIPATADANGKITMQFASVRDNALVNGIEIDNGTLPSPTPTPTPTPVTSLSIDSGGSSTGNFVADKDFTGGASYATTATVDTNSVTNPAPQAVYQSVRYGNMSYTIPYLAPNTNYTVRLHFSEPYWGVGNNSGGVGSRVFNVSINDTQVLTNFDIYHEAGSANKALVKEFTATSDTTGKISISFATVTDNAMINGIELFQ